MKRNNECPSRYHHKGMGIIPEARSKYLRKQKAATAIKYKLKDYNLSVIMIGSQLRANNQIQQSNGSNFNIIQRNIELKNILKL